MKASQQCWFGIVEHSEGVVLSVDYRFCVQKKVRRKFPEYTCDQVKHFFFVEFQNGMYTLEVSGDRKSIISCPISQAQPDWTDELEDPSKGVNLDLKECLN